MLKQTQWMVILLILVLCAGVSSYFIRFFQEKNVSGSQLSDREQAYLLVNDTTQISIEVVTTNESITLGLSGREKIGSDGMLFVFAESRQVSFWMKEMQFDLDLVWINDSQVIGVTRALKPESSSKLEDLMMYPSPEKVDMVLEVVAGDAERFGLRSGSRIEVRRK